MSTEIKFERNWCDYLTPCKHKNNIFVGSYECSKCSNFISSTEESLRFKSCDYSNYFNVVNGIVKCKK